MPRARRFRRVWGLDPSAIAGAMALAAFVGGLSLELAGNQLTQLLQGQWYGAWAVWGGLAVAAVIVLSSGVSTIQRRRPSAADGGPDPITIKQISGINVAMGTAVHIQGGIARLRAAGAPPGGRAAWVRQEGVLGQRQGDPSHTLTVWTEQEEVALDLYDAVVSRRHARLFFQGERLFLQHQGSESGTFLNGERLPSPGRGRPGASVPVTQAQAQVGLGPRCMVEVVRLGAPPGVAAREWGRLSGHLTYPNLNILCESGRWSQRLQATPADALLLAQFQEWYDANKTLFDQMVDVLRGQRDQVLEEFRVALDKYARAHDKSMDTMLEVVWALSGRSPAP